MTPKNANAYLRDVRFHLRMVEQAARFAEFHGASVRDMRQIRAMAEAMRKQVRS